MHRKILQRIQKTFESLNASIDESDAALHDMNDRLAKFALRYEERMSSVEHSIASNVYNNDESNEISLNETSVQEILERINAKKREYYKD